MTHNDYALIAQVFADLNSDFNNGGSDTVSLSIVAQELARALENDNPRQFHESAFLKACGLTYEPYAHSRQYTIVERDGL